jgi:hypothetical protein
MRIAVLSILTLFISLCAVFSQEKIQSNSDFPILKGPYLGQKPPGIIPELFAQGIIFGNRNRCFSKNGDHFCFVHVIDRGNKSDYVDYHMQIKNGKWTIPVPLDLNLNVPVKYPFFHPNGEKLVFASYVNEGKKINRDMDICIADYRNGEFSNMKILDSSVNTSAPERHPTISKGGTLYFYSIREGGAGGADIYYSELIDNKYQPAVNIGDNINTAGDEYNPFIAPDGSYLMFNSPNRKGIEDDHHDIYISFKNDDGSWTEAVNAGDKINSPYDDWAAYVTSDGRYFFFTSRKRSKGNEPDIYWVDAKIIKDLK